MLYQYEVHKVNIRKRVEFEQMYRGEDGLIAELGKGEDARLLWFTEIPMSTGISNTYVTLTAIEDAAAWGRLADRMHYGDLTDWRNKIDEYRHRSEGRLLKPVYWSKIQEIDLATVPTEPVEHKTTPILQEWMEPNDGKIPEYVELVERMMLPLYESPGGATYEMGEESESESLWVEMAGAFLPAFGGGGRQQQVLLWSPIVNLEDWLEFVMAEDPGKYPEGSWLDEASKIRGEWRSTVLRTASWSPLD